LSEERFRINDDNVVHEEVDGEVIAIDLANGCYYSLSGSAPAAWSLLARGASAEELGAALEARFEAEPGAIESAVSDLLDRFRESGLVVPAAGVDPPPTPSRDSERAPFQPPGFERFTDMKDYFLLDPIHEVGEAGWPHRPPSA
jgi:hypothetical protein